MTAIKKLKVFDYEDLKSFHHKRVKALLHKQYKPKLFFAECNGPTTADASAEVITGFTNEFIGAARAVSTIQCDAKSAYSNGEYFWFYLYNSGEEAHYFWYDVTGAGSDPSPGSGTAHKVDISADTTAANVASTLQGVMNAVSNLTASVSTDTVTAESDNVGNVTDASVVDSQDTITNVISGSDAGGGAYFYVVSSSANDDGAAGDHVQTVTWTVINTSDEYTTTTTDLNGTTIVKSSIKVKRIIAGYSTAWGTGGNDAAGNITARDYGGNDVYATVSAGSNETVSTRFYIANGYKAVIIRLLGSCISTVAAASDVPSKVGSKVHFKITDATDSDPDITNGFNVNAKKKLDVDNPFPFEIDGDNQGARISLYQEAVDADNTGDFHYKVWFLIWGTSNALRGLPA